MTTIPNFGPKVFNGSSLADIPNPALMHLGDFFIDESTE